LSWEAEEEIMYILGHSGCCVQTHIKEAQGEKQGDLLGSRIQIREEPSTGVVAAEVVIHSEGKVKRIGLCIILRM